MPNTNPALTAAQNRLDKAFDRLEAALKRKNTGGADVTELKAERDRYKREALEEAEKYKGLQGAAFNVSMQLDETIKRIDKVLEA